MENVMPKPTAEQGLWVATRRFITKHEFCGVLAGIAMVAALLTVKTAVECHSTLQLAHYDAPFLPSLLRAVVVWFWWAAVAFALWTLGQAHPKPVLLSRMAPVVQVYLRSRTWVSCA